MKIPEGKNLLQILIIHNFIDNLVLSSRVCFLIDPNGKVVVTSQSAER
jgi:hypothetical protein